MLVALSRPSEMENPSSGGRLWLQMENEGSLCLELRNEASGKEASSPVRRSRWGGALGNDDVGEKVRGPNRQRGETRKMVVAGRVREK